MGHNYNSTVVNNYTVVDITGVSDVGNLVGHNYSSLASESYWGVNPSFEGGEGIGTDEGTTLNLISLSVDQMVGAGARNNMSLLDFDTVWGVTDSYPTLQWLNKTTEESVAHLTLIGHIEPLIASVTIPTSNLEFKIDPNQEVGNQFIAPEFELINESPAPIGLSIHSFIQVTTILNDVLPDAHDSWGVLGENQSKDIALALLPKPSVNWLELSEGPRYVADESNYELGLIGGNSVVKFTFEAKHGNTFSELLNPAYQLSFIFDLR